jgi:hypothetical protein
MGWNLSWVHLVVRRHEKRRPGTLIPKETRVTYLILQTHRKPPLSASKTVLHSNPIQSSIKVLYQLPLIGREEARRLYRRRGYRRWRWLRR